MRGVRGAENAVSGVLCASISSPDPLPVPAARRRRHRRRIVIGLMSWLIATAGASALLAGSQSRARQAVEERFAIRASIASRFVTTYVGDLVARQKTQARRHLAARRVSATGFRRTVRDNGYSAAVLLDQHGHVMRVHPAKPALLGRDITGTYPHLRRALQGGVAVSKVVPSAARVPVVAFATPFASVDERRAWWWLLRPSCCTTRCVARIRGLRGSRWCRCSLSCSLAPLRRRAGSAGGSLPGAGTRRLHRRPPNPGSRPVMAPFLSDDQTLPHGLRDG